MAQQQADALALLAETALHHGLDPGASGERYQVVVHVDAPVLANPEAPGQSVLEGGTHVSAETSCRLACDASRVVMRHDPDGRVVEVGAKTRTIPPALRRALHHRDRGCRFPGCGVSFGQGHHIRHWTQGGPTTLSNLAMLCRRHHRAVQRTDIRSNDSLMASCGSEDRTEDRCTTSRLRPQSPKILSTRSERGTRRRGYGSTRPQRARAG
jgi:hypothetical protein